MDDSKLVEAAVRWGVIALLGSGAGYVSHRTEDAQTEAQHATSVSEIKELQQQIRELRSGVLQRVDTEEDERQEALKKHEHRLTRIETMLEIRLGAAPMPAEAAPAPPN